MKLRFGNLTWEETLSIKSVYKTKFINTINGDAYLDLERAEVETIVKDGGMSIFKTYKNGNMKIQHYIRIADIWYEFALDEEDEIEYNEITYYLKQEDFLEGFEYSKDIGHVQYLDRH